MIEVLIYAVAYILVGFLGVFIMGRADLSLDEYGWMPAAWPLTLLMMVLYFVLVIPAEWIYKKGEGS